MTQLGGSVNELKNDGLQMLSAGSWMNGLSKNKRSLLGSHTASSDHHKVILDLSVVNESSHRVDVLFGQIELGGGVGGVSSLSDSVDLLIHFGSLMVTELTASSDGPLNSGWMP